MKVLVLAGGRSAEREISFISAKWVVKQLLKTGHSVTEVFIDKNGSWKLSDSLEKLTISCESIPWSIYSNKNTIEFDVVLPILHGSYGEDGTIQGLCATAGWPCAGASVLGSAIAMEKHSLKKMARDAQIPVVPWLFLSEPTNYLNDLDLLKKSIKKLGFPLFVKPSRLGSSVGVSKVFNIKELHEAIRFASNYDRMILIEKAIDNLREIEVSVIGDGITIKSSVPGEIIAGNAWYDYEAKYKCENSKLVIPADIPLIERNRIKRMAEEAFLLIGGEGFARVDFFINDNGIWLNEINTIPGFTSISMFPKLWEATGFSIKQLFDFILKEAITRKEYGLSGDNNV